jgi:hypothetical protein
MRRTQLDFGIVTDGSVDRPSSLNGSKVPGLVAALNSLTVSRMVFTLTRACKLDLRLCYL